MGEWWRDALSAVGGWLSSLFGLLLDLLVAVWDVGYESLRTLALAAVDFAEQLLPEAVVDWLNAPLFATITDSINLVAWFLPVGPALALAAVVYGFVAVIRAVRWVKSLIPSISS